MNNHSKKDNLTTSTTYLLCDESSQMATPSRLISSLVKLWHYQQNIFS